MIAARSLLRTVLCLLLTTSAVGFLAPRTHAALPRERRFEIEYTATIKDIPSGAKQVDLWLPLPHDSPFQTIADLRIESPFPYHIGAAEYGNQVLHIVVKDPRQTAFTVAIRFAAVRKEHVQEGLLPASHSQPAEPRDRNMQRWLQPDRLVPINGKIREWALEVVKAAGATSDLAKAQAIYNHIVATVKYDKSGQGWGRGDIYYACDARRGNCTDFHAIFIGYCRALGIPARFAIGLPLPVDRGAGQISGYHCWAEFYIKGIGWVPVDASEAAKDPAKREYFFGAHDENRIEFSVGRDLILNPRQAGEPLNYFIYPYAEVDGKTYAAVDKSFAYRDIATSTASINSM